MSPRASVGRRDQPPARPLVSAVVAGRPNARGPGQLRQRHHRAAGADPGHGRARWTTSDPTTAASASGPGRRMAIGSSSAATTTTRPNPISSSTTWRTRASNASPTTCHACPTSGFPTVWTVATGLAGRSAACCSTPSGAARPGSIASTLESRDLTRERCDPGAQHGLQHRSRAPLCRAGTVAASTAWARSSSTTAIGGQQQVVTSLNATLLRVDAAGDLGELRSRARRSDSSMPGC